MKNTLLGKTTTQILSVLICAAIIIMIACCFNPYFIITEPYNEFLNPNPETDYYSLIDVMWCNTSYDEGEKINVSTNFSVQLIREHFEAEYKNFNFNDYVTSMVLGFLFGLGTVASSIVMGRTEFKRYPGMTSAIISHICGIACGVFTVIGYFDNDMLALGVEKFMFIRWVIVGLGAAILVLSLARTVIWVLTRVQLSKERKARLAAL